jgi:hypothetical protein
MELSPEALIFLISQLELIELKGTNIHLRPYVSFFHRSELVLRPYKGTALPATSGVGVASRVEVGFVSTACVH